MKKAKITLRDVSYTITNGITTPTVSNFKTVYADIKSVGYNEFYQATAAGVRTDLIFRVLKFEYEGQQEIVCRNDVYDVIRVYDNGVSNYVEITATRRDGK